MARGSSSTAATEVIPSPPSPPPVFIDTNLDTHLAMIVSPNDTVADLKRKVSLEHVICFPNIGDITVRSMKVRRKATYYHLSDAMLVRTAFDGIKGTRFLHMDVSPIDSDGNVAGGDANKTKWGVTDGPSSVDGLIKADSTMKLNDPSLRGVSLMPSVSGQNKSPRLELPSNDVLFISEMHGEASKNKSGTVKSSGKSENSAPELGDRAHVLNSESHKPFFEANRVSSSHFQPATDILTNQLNKDVSDEDFANLIDAANDGDASTVTAAAKEKSTKRSIKLEDGCLLKPSSGKKRRKKEEEKENAGSRKGHDKDLLAVIGTENVVQENISRDHIVGDVSLLGDVCSQLLKDDSILPQELLHEKKKRKKKRRKESDECHNEINAGVCLNASDRLKNSVLGTGLSEHTSNENGRALGKETIEDNQEKIFPINDNNLGSNSALRLPYEKNAEDSINRNHVEVDSEVLAKENRRIAHQRKKKVTKGELPSSELGNSEIIHPLGKQINGENPEEVPADDPKYLAIKPKREIAPEEAFRQGNAVEILPEALPNGGRSSSCSKERLRKAGSSKVKSRKDGAFTSATNIEETAIVAGNFIEAASLVPITNKSSTRSKKKSVKTKESFAEAPCEEDHPIAGPASFVEQSLTNKHVEASDERARFDVAFMPKVAQQGLVNTEGGHITKKSHGGKVQQGDTVNCDLVEPPKDFSTQQQSKSRKQKAATKPQVVQDDERRGKSDLPHANTSPRLQPSESSQDHQISENHDQDLFTGNKLKNPTHHAEEKGSVDYLGTSYHSGQQKTGGNSDNSMKQMNANAAESDDSTQEDTPYNEKLYRVAMRKKVSKSRSKRDLNKSKQEVFLNAADNIFGLSTSTSSEDEVEGHNGKDASKTVSNNLTSDNSEEDLEQTQVVIGPRAQMNTSSQGASPSSAHLLHKKEASDDDILLSQTSNAAKKRITLGVLLRSSHSYRKAKLIAQSQTDDTKNQPVDVVPETQPDYL